MYVSNPLRSARNVIILVGSIFFVAALYNFWGDASPSRFFDGSLITGDEGTGEAPIAIPVASPTSAPKEEPSTESPKEEPKEQPKEKPKEKPKEQPNHEDLEFYSKLLFKPLPIDAPHFRPWDSRQWNLTEEPEWTESLGQDLCIIDIDSRPFDARGEIFGPVPMSWDDNDEVHGLSLGVLNHWTYARIHGYKYYYVDFVAPEDRRASWKKPSIIRELLKKHKTCIFLDSDAIFHHANLPFEWLMNYWQIHPDKNSLALAFDPESDHNKDKFGKVFLNTGFIVLQNNPTTFEILDAWDSCPEDNSKYPGCKDFKKAPFGWTTDQGGFGTYVRYDYEKHIKELTCAEANGFPETGVCMGEFIQHMWSSKDGWLKVRVGEWLPGQFLPKFHEQFLKEVKTFRMTETELKDSSKDHVVSKAP